MSDKRLHRFDRNQGVRKNLNRIKDWRTVSGARESVGKGKGKGKGMKHAGIFAMGALSILYIATILFLRS